MKSPLRLLLGLGLLSAILPLLVFGVLVGRAPSLSVSDAWERLGSAGEGYALVDVRDREEYEQVHVEGSLSLPLPELLAWTTSDDLPGELMEARPLLLCNQGIGSAIAAVHLRDLGLRQASWVRGGLQEWIALETTAEGAQPPRAVVVGGSETLRPRAELSAIEQLTLLSALYLIKPLYMALAAGLIVILWRETSIRAISLRWSLAAFLVGELACWVNYQWLRTESTALEYVHSSTMVLTIAFLAYAAIDLIDRRLLRYTEPGAACILLDHCRGCAKHKDVPCLLNRLFQWTVFSLMVLSLIPLQTSTVPVSYNAEIFGQFRNLMHPLLVQLYEMRVVPLLGGVFLTLTLFGLRCRALRQSESPVVLLSVGVGHLGFAYFRTALLAFFRFDVVKFTFWEEGTELLLIASLIFILWAMRQDLFRGLLDRVVPGRA